MRPRRGTSGNEPRFKFQELLLGSLQIPLPPLAEQRRIVARIEELAAKIAEARSLRHQAIEEAEALLSSSRENRCAKQLGRIALTTCWETSVICDRRYHNTPALVRGRPFLFVAQRLERDV